MQVIHQFELEDADKIKNLWYRIVSSTDHHFAIKDTFRKYLPDTKESLLICTPYVSKDFFDMIRTLPNGTTVKLLTRKPNEKDGYMFGKTCRAIESLTQIANSLGLKLNVMCKPNLHAKFIAIDKRIILSGSVNPTSSGMYDNDEILYVFTNPRDVKRHVKIFDKLWNCPRNTTWQDLQHYFGHKGYGNRNSTRKAIAEAVIAYFSLNGNRPEVKSVLCQRMAKQGFNKDSVIEVVRELRRIGTLYEPNQDMYGLTHHQTNIHDY